MKLGGLATLGLINFFVPMCNGRGKQIIFGMAEELLRLSLAYGFGNVSSDFVKGKIPDSLLKDYADQGKLPPRYMASFSADICALVLTQLCQDAGVTLLFDTLVTQTVADPQKPGYLTGVVVENKSGRGFYAGSQLVDATGDADLLARAGVPTAIRGNYHSYFAKEITLASCKEAVQAKDISLAVHNTSGGHANLYGGGHPQEIPLYDGTDAAEVNRYLIANQLELLDKLKKTDRLSRDIVSLPGMAQFRTTRCIQGDYTLKEQDTYRHFEDSIGAICDFDRRDYLYEVPYRTLVHKDFHNIITCGRSAAAEGYAWDVLRVIPPAIITGQAAGIACAQAVDKNCAIGKVDIPALQAELEKESVLIHFDDADVPAESADTHEYND